MSAPSIPGNLDHLDEVYTRLYQQMNDIASQNAEHQIKMLHVQQRSDRLTEASTVRSNLQKAKHDAMMNIANNMK